MFQVNNLMAQTKMNIYYTNGSMLSIPISDIDTLYYINGNTCPVTVTDVDGNVYNVVKINEVCWMKENLRTAHYNDGTVIPTNLSWSQWNSTTSGSCADYNNDTANSSVYGKLYNWYALADTSELCPVGWHESEKWEWNELLKFIDANADTNCTQCISSSSAGGFLKESGTAHWGTPNVGANNSVDFTALPGGFHTGQGFSNISVAGYWWTAFSVSSTVAINLHIGYNLSGINKYLGAKNNGYSVRCVKD